MRVIVLTVLLVLLICARAQADGGGDSYHCGANPDPINASVANDGDVPTRNEASPHHIKWLGQQQLLRGNYNVSPTIIHGSTGTLAWSMPEQGSGYKKVVIVLLAYTSGAPLNINFPTPFDRGAAITQNVNVDPSTLSTSGVTIPAETAQSGVIVIEGI